MEQRLIDQTVIIIIALCVLVVVFHILERKFSDGSTTGPKFPSPNGDWNSSGIKIPLKNVPALSGNSPDSRRRTISPFFDELRARELWERSCGNLSEALFYANGNPLVASAFISTPIYILYGIQEFDGHFVVSNRPLFAKMGFKQLDDVEAKLLAKRVDGNIYAEGHGARSCIQSLNRVDAKMLKRFLLIERFGDTLVLAGRHGWRGTSTDRFLADIEEIKKIFQN